MEICSQDHVEIVHTEGWRKCPLCAALDTISVQEEDMRKLRERVEELEEELRSQLNREAP